MSNQLPPSVKSVSAHVPDRRVSGGTSTETQGGMTEAALKESEERFALAVAGANDGIWDWNIVTNQTFMSDRGQRLYGLEPGPSVRPHFEWRAMIRLHPDDVLPQRQMVEDYLAGRAPAYNGEWRVRHSDGSYRWVHVSGLCVRDTAGRATRLTGSLTDIDEQKRTEQALRESDQRYALAMQASQDGHWDWVIAGDQFYASPRMLEMYGFGPGTIFTGRSDFVRQLSFLPEDRGPWEQATAAHFAGTTLRFDTEIRMVRNGEIRWMNLRGLVSRDVAGKPVRWTGSVSDITDRINGEAALRKSEERFSLAIAASTDGIWEADPVANTMFMSDRAQKLHGLEVGPTTRSRAEWRAAINFHPDDSPRRTAMFDEFLAGHTLAFNGEWRVRHPDGIYRWVRIRGLCDRDTSGVAKRVAGSTSDIDLQKRAEQALQHSERRYALAIEAARDGHWDWIIENDVFYVSPRVLEIYGFPPEFRYTGRADFIRQVPFQDQAARTTWEINVAVHLAGKDLRRNVDLKILRNGEVRWIQHSGLVSRDTEGKPVRWTGSMRDVTDRKDAEEALRKSEERFALAVAASNDGIWEVDVAGNQTFMSDRAQRLCGVAAGPSVRSRSAWRDMVFFNPGDFENLKAMFESYIKGQVTTFDGEWRVGHSDGNWRWVRIRGLAARDDTGRAVRIAGSISDIDSQKCAEAALQQAQRLEAVGTLAGGIAHDFNNILGAILGFGEMALRNTRAGSRMRRDVELIVKAGERGRTLVERVLAFSRTGFGERMPVQAEAVVNEVLHLISATLPEAVRIESRLLTGTAAILGDSTQLHQVVMNLVANAVQAMPTGGQLLVTLDNAAHDAPLVVTTGELAAGDYLVLTVADTGVGIPPEIVARIFDPFFTTREVDHGTGLGLSLVHGIVAEFGGKVNVATAIGSGSTFTVYLPRLGDVDEGEADSTAPSPRGANERVLVVDDERPLLTLVASALDNLGYRAFGYSSSLEALLAFKEDPDRFDALVTDERMPGLSGTALIHAVRELRPNFPTLLVSGYLGGDVVARARQASVDAVLGKPLATRELARALARALRLRKSQQYNTNGSSI